jgi:hypothetical protein
MGMVLWTAAGVLAGLIVMVWFLAAGRDRLDPGSVSGSWVAEHRANHDRES